MTGIDMKVDPDVIVLPVFIVPPVFIFHQVFHVDHEFVVIPDQLEELPVLFDDQLELFPVPVVGGVGSAIVSEHDDELVVFIHSHVRLRHDDVCINQLITH